MRYNRVEQLGSWEWDEEARGHRAGVIGVLTSQSGEASLTCWPCN